jgi:hypothetical protein
MRCCTRALYAYQYWYTCFILFTWMLKIFYVLVLWKTFLDTSRCHVALLLSPISVTDLWSIAIAYSCTYHTFVWPRLTRCTNAIVLRGWKRLFFLREDRNPFDASKTSADGVEQPVILAWQSSRWASSRRYLWNRDRVTRIYGKSIEVFLNRGDIVPRWAVKEYRGAMNLF